MAAELREAGMVAIYIAVGCREILKHVLHFLEGSPARGPALDAAVLLAGFAVEMAYLAGIILVILHLTPAAGTPVVRAAFRQYVLFLCALLVLLFGAFQIIFLAAGGW